MQHSLIAITARPVVCCDRAPHPPHLVPTAPRSCPSFLRLWQGVLHRRSCPNLSHTHEDTKPNAQRMYSQHFFSVATTSTAQVLDSFWHRPGLFRAHGCAMTSLVLVKTLCTNLCKTLQEWVQPRSSLLVDTAEPPAAPTAFDLSVSPACLQTLENTGDTPPRRQTCQYPIKMSSQLHDLVVPDYSAKATSGTVICELCTIWIRHGGLPYERSRSHGPDLESSLFMKLNISNNFSFPPLLRPHASPF